MMGAALVTMADSAKVYLRKTAAGRLNMLVLAESQKQTHDLSVRYTTAAKNVPKRKRAY
jgi:hypothetical protein